MAGHKEHQGDQKNPAITIDQKPENKKFHNFGSLCDR
jgi:hypothetical protein